MFVLCVYFLMSWLSKSTVKGEQFTTKSLKFLMMPFEEIAANIELNLHSSIDSNSSERRIICSVDKTTQLVSAEIPRSFSSEWPVKVYVHGFNSEPLQDMRNAWLRMANGSGINILMVDWSELAGIVDPHTSNELSFFRPYTAASRHAMDVGSYLGLCLAVIFTQQGVDYSQLHLVGHSLGAHLIGKAGRVIKELTGHLPGRATGLDPAGPKFVNTTSSLLLNLDPELEMISRESAQFVDIIHTNGVEQPGNFPLRFGYIGKMGHVDFYPNGGADQPPPKYFCPFGGWFKNVCFPHSNWLFYHNHHIESHSMANTYFIKTILNERLFKSQACNCSVCPLCQGDGQHEWTSLCSANGNASASGHDDLLTASVSTNQSSRPPSPPLDSQPVSSPTVVEMAGSCHSFWRERSDCYMGEKASKESCSALEHVTIDCHKDYFGFIPYCENKTEL